MKQHSSGGIGNDEVNADYQKLESGNDVRLIEVDGSSFGLTDVLGFTITTFPHTEAEIVAAGGQ
ncbi:hypothetical protein ACVXG7_17160 [Enterobacter hormaechei]